MRRRLLRCKPHPPGSASYAGGAVAVESDRRHLAGLSELPCDRDYCRAIRGAAVQPAAREDLDEGNGSPVLPPRRASPPPPLQIQVSTTVVPTNRSDRPSLLARNLNTQVIRLRL